MSAEAARTSTQRIFLRLLGLLMLTNLAMVLIAVVWLDHAGRGLIAEGERHAAKILAEGIAASIRGESIRQDYDGLEYQLRKAMQSPDIAELLVTDAGGQVLSRLRRARSGGDPAGVYAVGRVASPDSTETDSPSGEPLMLWVRVDPAGGLGWLRVSFFAGPLTLRFQQMRWQMLEIVAFGVALMLLLMLAALRSSAHAVNRREGVMLEHQSELRDAAYRDRLTGLPNRAALMERLGELLAARRGSEPPLAVCFLDLDGFKGVNDRFGHAIGDLLLIEVARRLQACVREGDLVVRLAGDEFVLLLEGEVRPGELHRLLDRVVMRVSAAFMLGDQRLQVGVSIGVAVCEAAGAAPETLLVQADEAMYQAKRSGRNRWVLHESVGGALFGPPASPPVAGAPT